MSFIQYLKINGENLPLPDSYDVELSAIEADTKGGTEAGTMQRDVIRVGVISIGITFTVTALWLKKLTTYSKQDKLTIEYFDTEMLELKQTEMYIEGFRVKLEKDTSYKSLWSVSFRLIEI
ncbi:MAG: hypothetical protein RSE61_05410 [Anaerovoracaceae bacterium]